MDFDVFLFVLVSGSLLFVTLNWVYFHDWMRFVGFFLKIIAPDQTYNQIEKEKTIRRHPLFKNHQKKWKKNFLIVPLAFDVVFVVLSFLLKNLLAAFFLGAIVATFLYGTLEKKEKCEQTNIVKIITKAEKQGDSLREP